MEVISLTAVGLPRRADAVQPEALPVAPIPTAIDAAVIIVEGASRARLGIVAPTIDCKGRKKDGPVWYAVEKTAGRQEKLNLHW